eukprot:CAMPEP_0179209964 /NCGR_PEP_ID=MMETSP0796-20121207/104718_1 /TAXON_ID=73915 /ORGANISM="Pyrodinium bahamense, Strain pbaha01" /LENGTH=353 /DNA_ID=CAMNT_0020914925 /DNA_START=15 /DNA_END=1073 /DNA_ORIENTATION=-
MWTTATTTTTSGTNTSLATTLTPSASVSTQTTAGNAMRTTTTTWTTSANIETTNTITTRTSTPATALTTATTTWTSTPTDDVITATTTRTTTTACAAATTATTARNTRTCSGHLAHEDLHSHDCPELRDDHPDYEDHHTYIAMITATTTRNTRTTTAVSASAWGPSCFEAGAAYDPIDMDARFIIRVADAEECRSQCAALPLCHHFSYYEPLGHCHFEDAFAVKAHYRPGFISGPPSCEDEEAAGRLSQLELECLEPGTAYSPSIYSERLDYGLSAREAVVWCQRLCADLPQCARFTVDFGSPAAGHLCSLTGVHALRSYPVLRQISGPPSCKWSLVRAKFLQDGSTVGFAGR